MALMEYIYDDGGRSLYFKGKTVIINTLEIPEIQKVADRCVVFYEGRIVKIFRHEEVNEHDVMLYSTNAIETDREGTKS